MVGEEVDACLDQSSRVTISLSLLVESAPASRRDPHNPIVREARALDLSCLSCTGTSDAVKHPKS